MELIDKEFGLAMAENEARRKQLKEEMGSALDEELNLVEFD